MKIEGLKPGNIHTAEELLNSKVIIEEGDWVAYDIIRKRGSKHIEIGKVHSIKSYFGEKSELKYLNIKSFKNNNYVHRFSSDVEPMTYKHLKDFIKTNKSILKTL